MVKPIMETPAAKPSKPSIKFTALVKAKIHKIVTGRLNQPSSHFPKKGKLILSISIPATKKASKAASVMPINFCQGFSSKISSNSPVTTTIAPPKTIGQVTLKSSISRKPNKTETEKAVKMANPPAEGMGFLLMRRAFGMSTAPILQAKTLTSGVKTKDKINVMKNCKINVKAK